MGALGQRMRHWLWCCGLGLLLGRVEAVSLVDGPTVEASATNAIIRWTTDSESGARVRFGVSPSRLDQRAQGEGVATNHVVELKNLRPGTKYHFTAGTARVALATNSFSTLARDRAKPTVQPPPDDSPSRVAPADDGPAELPRPPPTRVTWGSVRTLQDHFDRHGADFAAKDPDDYAAQAWLFLVRAQTEGYPAKQDSQGVVRVFDPKTGAFAAYNRDGTTKTYFKPGRRGYFADQPGRPVDLRQLRSFQPPQ